jgi:hypothetical protein
MQSFLRRLAILERLRVSKQALSSDEILSFLENEGYIDEALPTKSKLRIVQRDFNFLYGEEDEEGCSENEFGLEKERGNGRSHIWRLDPYNNLHYDFEKMPQNMAIAFAMTEKHLSDLLPRNTHKELKRIFDVAEHKLAQSEKNLSIKDFRRFKDSVEFYQRGQTLQAANFNIEHLDTIYRAVLHRKQLGFAYRGKTYQVHPLGVAILLPKMYLVAIKQGDQNSAEHCRNFLVHKIESAWVESASSEEPEGFCLKHYLELGNMDVLIDFEDAGRYTLELLIDKGQERLVEDLRESPISHTQELIALDSDQILLKAEVKRSVQLRNWLLSVAGVSEVLAPLEIRQDISNYLNASLSKYQA